MKLTIVHNVAGEAVWGVKTSAAPGSLCCCDIVDMLTSSNQLGLECTYVLPVTEPVLPRGTVYVIYLFASVDMFASVDKPGGEVCAVSWAR